MAAEIEWEPLEIENVRASLGLPEDEVVETPFVEQPKPKPSKKSPRFQRAAERVTEEATKTFLPPPKLTTRDEKKVKERLENILIAGTGIPANIKEYIQMQQEEAEAIADPLASYLVNNADLNPVAQQILENYDLLAVALGAFAYVTRVARDRQEEVAANRATSVAPIHRIRQTSDDGEETSEVWENAWISNANGASGRGITGL